MKFKFFFVLLFTGALVENSFAQTFNKVKMDSLMTIMSTKNKAMLSIALCQNGKIVYSNAIGYSSTEADHKTRATTLTRYRIGSVTKVFTSAMIFQLIDEGKLSLNDMLSRYFPDLPNASEITIAQLLNHSSGLHNFTSDSSYVTMLSHKVTEAEMLNKFAIQKADFIPGSKHQYSNTNFILLGYIIEKLDHLTYAQSLSDRILKKIGLSQTYYGAKINPAAGEAISYKWQNAWLTDTETDTSIPAGAGALVSTPAELTHFITALFAGKLISNHSLTQMTTINGGYGMDLVAYNFDDKIGYGHNGGIDGFESQVVYYPKEKLATAYIANGVNVSLKKMMQGVLSIYFNQVYKLPVFNSITVAPEELNKFTGSYSSKDARFKLKFRNVSDKLVAEFSDEHEPLYLDATGLDSFTYDHYDIEFIFNSLLKQVRMISGSKTFLLKKERD